MCKIIISYAFTPHIVRYTSSRLWSTVAGTGMDLVGAVSHSQWLSMPPDGWTQSPSHQECPSTGCAAGRGLLQIQHLTSCVDRPIITGIFLTWHISVAAACQPEHGQSGNVLQQVPSKLLITTPQMKRTRHYFTMCPLSNQIPCSDKNPVHLTCVTA